MKTEVQEWIEAKYRNYFAYISRPGAADLLQWIEANGFFEAPASKRHHGAKPGGLAEHSINVFRRLLWLNAEEEKRRRVPQYDVETLAICGLLHDLCKIDAYKKVDFTVYALDTRRDSGNQVAHGAV